MKVLYVKVHDSVTCRMKYAGVMRYARPRDWEIIQLDARNLSRVAPKTVKASDADGCIVDGCSDRGSPVPVDLGVPTVYLDIGAARADSRMNSVVHDNVATVGLGLSELESGDLDCLYYADWCVPPRAWAVSRRKTFRTLARGLNCRWGVVSAPCDIYHPKRLREYYSRKFRTFRRPFAVLAANDEIAENVVAACELAGISVPREARVLGIDNDISICDRTRPPVSSIQVDFERGGYRAAEMLDELVQTGRPVGRTACFGPLAVIRRHSTSRSGRMGPHLFQAVELIRREACHGIRAKDVIAVIGGSRRNAEMRFRQSLGHSILDEINSARFEAVVSYLKRGNVSFAAIADFCSFGSVDALRVQFRRRFGMSMRTWKRLQIVA